MQKIHKEITFPKQIDLKQYPQVQVSLIFVDLQRKKLLQSHPALMSFLQELNTRDHVTLGIILQQPEETPL
jgi:DNA gyrase inhibitor GyrI